MARKPMNKTAVSLGSSKQRELWLYWYFRRPEWVTGIYDGSLSWTEEGLKNISEFTTLLQDFFFGLEILEQQYLVLLKKKLIPPGLIANSVPSPVATTKVRPRSKQTVLLLAWNRNLEIGRAMFSLQTGWTIIKWDGVQKQIIGTTGTIKEAMVLLGKIPGATRVTRRKI